MTGPPILHIDDLCAHYGTAQILFGVSFDVPPGSIIALLGRNGAGKTTTLKSVMRIEVRTTGTVEFDGVDTRRMPTYRIARAGIGYVPGDRRILPEMTVRDNLELGRYIAETDRPPADFESVLAYFPMLRPLLSRRGGYLSGGEQQMLTIARCLIGNPRLILLDEPSEGLAPKIVAELIEILAAIHAELATSILITEQNTAMALTIASHVGLIDSGRIVFFGERELLQENAELMHRYLGVQAATAG